MPGPELAAPFDAWLVTVYSIPGRGTTCRVFLPAVDSSTEYKVANA